MFEIKSCRFFEVYVEWSVGQKKMFSEDKTAITKKVLRLISLVRRTCINQLKFVIEQMAEFGHI